MGEITLPRHAFLWCVSAIYMFAFASLYVQIPGLYGNEGVLPARWRLRYVGKPVLEQMAAAPTLLWLGPRLALDTQQGLELLALAGTALSLGATAFPQLSHSAVYLTLWLLYLSLYQVGQVFLYFQWDNLLLEVGFLAVLIAPLKLPWSQRGRFHDGMTFWLARWLLFRLMFASGVVKLTSRCPTWWGLTALTYHYETQCIPTSLAWFAHQLPVWLHKLSVVCTFLIEIAVPMLFFSPLRRHRLTAFYLQVLLQVCIILSGNYNFFNLLTVALCLSLLDDAHINFLLRRPSQDQEPHSQTWLQTVLRCVCVLVEVCVYALLAYWMVLYFDLQVDWDKKSISSKTAFTYHQFNAFLKAVMVPSIWMGVFSLTWEIISAMFRCACVSGVWRRLWSTLQWGVMAAAAVSMFAISLVPFTFIEYEANSSLWPGVRKVFEATDRFQLVNSYGLFRRMTGVGGRPEVVIEGSMDRNTWTEIEFMYKPGNVSAAPPLVMPHQPRLDWQMWFAALGPQEQSPWFTSLVYRLLQGKRDVIRLIQADESRYPFSQQPPAFIRAHRYKYWFTEPTEDGTHPQRWWRRVYVEEFYPIVHLGDSFLERMLSQYGLKDKAAVRRGSEAVLPWLLACVRERVHGLDALRLLWSLIGSAVLICLLRSLTRSHTRTHTYTHTHARDKLDRTATEPEHNATATKPAAGDTQLHPDQEEEEERQEEEEKGERDEEKRERGEDELEEEQEEDDDYDKEEEKEEEAETSSDDLRKRK